MAALVKPFEFCSPGGGIVWLRFLRGLSFLPNDSSEKTEAQTIHLWYAEAVAYKKAAIRVLRVPCYRCIVHLIRGLF